MLCRHCTFVSCWLVEAGAKVASPGDSVANPVWNWLSEDFTGFV